MLAAYIDNSSIRLPDGMNSLFPAKILVRTGPAYKDEGCTQTADIEVDLLPPGKIYATTFKSCSNFTDYD
jgi:hypothetical protein